MHSPENGGRPVERKTGEVLIERGMISREQLDKALEIQKTSAKYLGRILVSMGYVGEEDLARGLGPRLGTEYVALLGHSATSAGPVHDPVAASASG